MHETQQERDASRDAALALAGIRTLRFRNEEVLGDTPAVLRRIERELGSAQKPKVPSPAQFAGEGGGSQAAG